MKNFIIVAGLIIVLSGVIISDAIASDYNPETKSPEELKSALEQMPLEDKLNAEIRLLMHYCDDEGALLVAREFETLWNFGKFDEALEKYSELGQLTDLNKVSIGTQWRQPIVTENPKNTSAYYRVGTRDSVYVVNYDIQRSTGNMLAVLLRHGDGYASKLSVNFSNDGGVTWQEKWGLSMTTVVLDADCAIYGNYGLVTIIDLAQYVYTYKVDMSDGGWIPFESAAYSALIYTSSAVISEIDMESIQDIDLILKFKR